LTDNNRPGWYEDPDAPDLLRWWDGTRWSDTEFAAKAEDSAIVAHFRSYAELSPRSPTNYLAISTVICAAIEFACAAFLIVFTVTSPGVLQRFGSALLVVSLSGVVALCAGWTTFLGALAVANGRRWGGKRVVPAAIGLVVGAIATSLMVTLLVVGVPRVLEVPL